MIHSPHALPQLLFGPTNRNCVRTIWYHPNMVDPHRFPPPETVDGPYPGFKYRYMYREQAEALLSRLDQPGQWYEIGPGHGYEGRLESFLVVLRREGLIRNRKVFTSMIKDRPGWARIMYKKVMRF